MKRTRDCFRLYPALDLVDGRAVRLLQGQFDVLLTSDHDDVLRRAEAIWAAGSTALHVIDLDADGCDCTYLMRADFKGNIPTMVTRTVAAQQSSNSIKVLPACSPSMAKPH